MKTKKQEALVQSFLETLDDGLRHVYREIIMYLSELGYNPSKEKSSISFKHDLHNKQIAKMGMRSSKKYSPFFSLRFSACRGYSQKFGDIVAAYINKYPTRAARCVGGGCNYCAGEAASHVYMCTGAEGEGKAHCGAYAIEIPDITVDEVDEIKKIIGEEHGYLLKYESGR